MKIEPDAWLTEIMGRAVFRVSLSDEKDDLTLSPETILASARSKPAFFYAKVLTVHVDQVRALGAAGFTVIDVNMTFEREPAADTTFPRPSLVVREALPTDRDAALDIAASCFVYSRFHLDPQIPNQIANAVKRAWIASYFRRQRGERLLVAECDGKPVGFLAVLSSSNSLVRVIDLIGVDKAHQGRGVGKGLVEFFIRDSFGKFSCLRVGTQAANVPSIRLYENLGFRIAETKYILHAHVQNGQVQA